MLLQAREKSSLIAIMQDGIEQTRVGEFEGYLVDGRACNEGCGGCSAATCGAQHQCSHALAAAITVGAGVKGLAAAGGGQRLQLADGGRRAGGQHEVDACRHGCIVVLQQQALCPTMLPCIRAGSGELSTLNNTG
jgi:hypothetical protein